MIIVDRIENGIAVCEVDGVMTDIPLIRISGNVREGDVLKESSDGLFFMADISATDQQRAAISERFERLKARKKSHE